MKVQARLAETGVLLQAGSEADWAIARPSDGHRPQLFCPECHVRVTAAQIPKNPKPGQRVTRSFRFVPGQECGHREVREGATVRAPERSGETDEHAWLKQFVLEVAYEAGYTDAQLEQTLNEKVRADVYIPSAAARKRVEVQRVSTDVPGRTDAYSDVVWLLRSEFAARQQKTLFTLPCVHVRISARGVDGRWIPAEPWVNGVAASVRATATVLHPRKQPQAGRYGFFVAFSMDLDEFLRQVWSGDRQWCHDKLVHHTAGWVTPADKKRYDEWIAEQQRRHAEEMKHRAALAAEEVERERARREQERQEEEQKRLQQEEQERVRQAAARREQLQRERVQRAEDLLATDPTRRPLLPPSSEPSPRGFWRRLGRSLW